MTDPLMRPVKTYRAMSEAFKDKDYACAVEKTYSSVIPWWTIPAWVAVICAVMLAVWVLTSFGRFPVGG